MNSDKGPSSPYSNRWRLGESLVCADYHRGFDLLLVGGMKDVRVVTVNRLEGHGLTSTAPGYVSSPASSSPKPPPSSGAPNLTKSSIFSCKVHVKAQKVEHVAWHPTDVEGSFAFIELAKVTILIGLLRNPHSRPFQFKRRPNLNNQKTGVAQENRQMEDSTSSHMSLMVKRGMPRSVPSSPAVPTAPGSGIGGARPSPTPPDTFTSSPTDMIELSIPIDFKKTNKVVWDPHHPYTLAFTSVLCYFEIWEIPVKEVVVKDDRGVDGAPPRTTRVVGPPRFLMRPPVIQQRRPTRIDMAFSSSPQWIVVVTDTSGTAGEVLVMNRLQPNEPPSIVWQMSSCCLTVAFHPYYRDLFSVSYRNRSKSACTVELCCLKIPPQAQEQEKKQEEGGHPSSARPKPVVVTAERSVFPPIHTSFCVSRFRWRPYVPAITTTATPTGASAGTRTSPLSPSESLFSQLWFITNYVDIDTNVTLWDPTFPQTPLAMMNVTCHEAAGVPTSTTSASNSTAGNTATTNNNNNSSSAPSTAQGAAGPGLGSSAVLSPLAASPSNNSNNPATASAAATSAGPAAAVPAPSSGGSAASSKPALKRKGEIDAVPVDIVWADAVSIIAIFRNGDIVFISLFQPPSSEGVSSPSSLHSPQISTATAAAAAYESPFTSPYVFPPFYHYCTVGVQSIQFGQALQIHHSVQKLSTLGSVVVSSTSGAGSGAVSGGAAAASVGCGAPSSRTQELREYYRLALEESRERVQGDLWSSTLTASAGRSPSPPPHVAALLSTTTTTLWESVRQLSTSLTMSTRDLDVNAADNSSDNNEASATSSLASLIQGLLAAQFEPAYPHIHSTVAPPGVGGYLECPSSFSRILTFALEWNVGYEVVLHLQHCRRQLTGEENANAHFPLRFLFSMLPRTPRPPSLACSGAASSGGPSIRRSEALKVAWRIDRYFSRVMRKNAAVCAAAIAGSGSSGDVDVRHHWWQAAAHAWESHSEAFILTLTTAQLEAASLMGDVQYCLVLYQLYGLWYILRGMYGCLPPASGEGQSPLFYFGQDSPPPSCAEWQKRALHWMDRYTHHLLTAGFCVPIHELQPITQEVFNQAATTHANHLSTALTPLSPLAASSRVHYDMKQTYVYCQEPCCTWAGQANASAASPMASMRFASESTTGLNVTIGSGSNPQMSLQNQVKLVPSLSVRTTAERYSGQHAPSSPLPSHLNISSGLGEGGVLSAEESDNKDEDEISEEEDDDASSLSSRSTSSSSCSSSKDPFSGASRSCTHVVHPCFPAVLKGIFVDGDEPIIDHEETAAVGNSSSNRRMSKKWGRQKTRRERRSNSSSSSSRSPAAAEQRRRYTTTAIANNNSNGHDRSLTSRDDNYNLLQPSSAAQAALHKPERMRSPHRNASCPNCNNATSRTMICALCEVVVEGLFVRFPRCSHGGHLHHVREWIGKWQETMCPTCGASLRTSDGVGE